MESQVIRLYFLLMSFVEDQLEDLRVDMPSKIILKLLMREIWRYGLD